MRRTAIIALVAALVAGIGGYVAGARRVADPASLRSDERPGGEGPSDEDDAELGSEPATLQVCEERLAAAESALAQRPRVDAPVVDPASLPDEARAVIARPDVTRAIELEVERRIEERFQREREQRRAEWAARRAEMRERMRAIGIDDATMAEVTPAMCAIRDVFRQAWQARREGGGDGGVPMGRRAIREATRGLREEVEGTLGAERVARLEEEGGLRALGGAVECPDEG